MGIRGFTFIEIILVILLIGIVVPGLVSAVAIITKGQVNPMGATVSVYLAQEELERVIARKQSACASCGYANLPVGLGAFAPVSGYPNYQRKTDIERIDANLNPSVVDQGYKKVTVTLQDVGVGPAVPNAVLVTVLTNQ